MPPTHTQKNLTVMFTDIAGFTRHTEQSSREAMMRRLESHNRLLMPIIAHFEGRIIKTIGDAFLIVFESPTNAVQCGMLMQHRLKVFNRKKAPAERIDVKVSVNAGEVTVTEDDVFGDPVNVAAKIEKATSPGETYFTEAVFLAMNKAEVPNTFVKTFRPRGAESAEIKLFKVVMDEDDPVFRKIVDDTKIDEEATKAKVSALATVSEREATRWQDALDHLVESHRRSTRTLLIAVAIGAVVLAGLVLGGFALLRHPAGAADDPSKALAEGARANLASGKVEAARGLLDTYVAKHGASDASKAVADEIDAAGCTIACEAARGLLETGKDAEAIAALRAAYPKAPPTGPAAAMLARAEAFGRARAKLLEGHPEPARAAITEAAGGTPPTGELAVLLARADAIDEARRVLASKDAGKDALKAIAALSLAYGDATGDPVAVDLIGRALAAQLFTVGRDEGPKVVKERLEESRQRFKNLTEWGPIRREADLGSLWAYGRDPELRRNWQHSESEDLSTLLRSLHEAGAKDPEFLFRLGQARYAISHQNDLAVADGMLDIEEAVKQSPSLLDAHDAELLEMTTDWLLYDQSQGSFGRRLAIDRYFERLRPTLLVSLVSMYGEGTDARPDVGRRANAYAVLAAKGDLTAIKDRVVWLREALSAFVEGDPASLSLEQAKALFASPMTPDEFRGLKDLLEGEADAARAKEGRFGANVGAADRLDAMAKALKSAQPELAKGK